MQAYDKIELQHQKEKILYPFLHKYPSKRLFRNGIHSLLRRSWRQREC